MREDKISTKSFPLEETQPSVQIHVSFVECFKEKFVEFDKKDFCNRSF